MDDMLNHIDTNLGWPALFKSVICGHLSGTISLLKEGADPNIRTKMGETPLHQACQLSNQKTVELLLEYGADPNIRSNDGDTPLHHASQSGNSELILLLLDKGAEVNVTNDIFGSTPLHYAVDNDHREIAKILVKRGASCSVLDNAGNSPVNLAKSDRMREIFNKDRHSRNNSAIEPDAEKTASEEWKSARKKHLLYTWLAGYKLEEVFDLLVDAGYDDLEQLTWQISGAIPLNEQSLKEIGVRKTGKRLKLLLALHCENKPRTSRLPREKPGFFQCCTMPVPSNNDFMNLPSLERWLDSIGLKELLELFYTHGFDDVETLLALMHTQWKINETLLKKIGVYRARDRQKLLAKLREEAVYVDSIKRYSGNVSKRTEEVTNQSCFIM